MVKKSVAREYAKALSDSVSPSLFKICAQNASVFGKILKDIPKIVKVFENPAISSEKKAELIDLIGKSANFDQIFSSFLKLVVEKRRISLWNDIEKEIYEISDQIDGVVRGKIVSFPALSEKEKEEIQKEISAKLNKKVVLIEETDPKVIGGFKVKIGSKVFDSTFETALAEMKNYLLKR
ncbi:MAG: ATP synthase F1 subunit delta [Thermoanaerobaculaceae bacterium]|nr:ATP synthase F1 subunit delta [Thermoanaerobaculaceae bacterium]